MIHSEAYPQASFSNPQLWGLVNPQGAQYYGQGGLGQQGSIFGQGSVFGPGQAAFGQPGSYSSPFGQAGPWGQGPNIWQRQLSQQDIGEVVRQLLPLLPQVVAQAQQQPQAAFGYNPYAQQGPFGQGHRQLTQQDVNEVVRQLLPILPQIVSLLQGQSGPQATAIHGGGYGWGNQQHQPWQIGQAGYGQNPWSQYGQQQYGQQQQPFGLFGSGLPFQAAFGGGGQSWGQSWGQQRQLSQADVSEVVRQLSATIPQLIANLQAFNQQQQQQRAV